MDINNGVLFVWYMCTIPAGTFNYTLPISFTGHMKCIASRNTFNFSLAMTNILAGIPNLSTIQINSGSNTTEIVSILCFGI